jgi:cobalt-zinc-cadmium efflux system outer membrane protein
MKSTYLLLFGLTSIGVIRAVRADENPAARPALTLAEAGREAWARNTGIQEALSRWNAARERVPQEGAWDDLQVSAMSRLARFVSIPRNGFADQTLSVSQIIPVTGKNRSRARAAAAEALMAYEDARRRELDVAAQTRGAYYRLANARAQVELNRENLVLLKQIAEVSRVRYQAGDQSAADVLGAETEAGKLLEDAKDLARAVTTEETQLNVLMGRDAFAPVGELDATQGDRQPIELAPLERLRALTLENRPEVRSAEDRVEAEKARLELAHRAWIPDPTLSVEGQRYNSAGQGVSELDAGVSFNIPWTNGPKYTAGTREAVANVAAAEQALETSRREAMGMLRTTLEDVETAHHHLHISGDKLLMQARDGLKASEIGYEAGKVSLSEWIAAARMVRDLESMERQQASDYAVAIAQLEAVIGTPLTSFSNHP